MMKILILHRITEENDGPPEASQPVASEETHSGGNNLYLRTLRGLFLKKLLYAIKDFSRYRQIYSVMLYLVKVTRLAFH